MSKLFAHTVLAVVALLLPVAALADNFVGRVLDDNGSPLMGAVVETADGKTVVVTGADGKFEFSVPQKGAVRVSVSYLGFVPASVVVRSDTAAKGNVITLLPDNTQIGEVVVTATRTPKTLKDVPVITRLITSDMIKKSDASNIQDLLTEELPGLEFGYAMSQETSLNMNGFGGSAVLFLVDGERLAGETMDNVDYNRLNLDNVGQVEIVKGASSALYGANAVGGVVNLITREKTEPWSINLNSRYRSAGNEWRSSGNVSFNVKKWYSDTAVQHSTSETVRLTDAFDAKSRIHDVFGGHTLNVKERLVYRAGDNLRFIARGGYFSRVSNRINYDDRYRDYSGGLKCEWHIDTTQYLELSYGYDRYDKARFVGGDRTHDHDYSNRQHIVHALYAKAWGEHTLTVGADCMHDYLTTYQFADDGVHSQTSVDAFVQFDCKPLKWLNVIASVRDDYFSESDNNALTARLATLFKLKPLSVRASYAGGFRAPTLKEMYMCFDMAGIQMIYGNPNLKPERSHNFNISVERNGYVRRSVFAGTYNVTLTGYCNLYDSRITTTDFEGDAAREAGAIYTNEAGVKVLGLDLSARYRMQIGIGLSVSYNFMHMAGNVIDSQFSQPRPHSATWRIDYDRQICRAYGLYAAVSGRYLSKPVSSYETDGAYTLWKFTLQQRIWRGIGINFIVDNLFGYKPDIYYWNSPPTVGRTWSVGISMDIDKFFGKFSR